MTRRENMDAALAAMLDRIGEKRRERIAQTGTTRTQTSEGGNGEKLVHELMSHGIDRRYWNVSLEGIERDLPDNASIKRNYRYIKQYTANLENHIARGEGLILAGKYGTMKTTMAVAVLKHQLLDRHGGGYFVPMATLIDNLFSMRARDREEAARYEHRLRTTPLLVIDDLGAENTTQDFILAKTDSIITERYNRLLPTIITTNYSAADLQDTYGGRIIDRIKSTCYYLEFRGDSERRALKLDTI